MKSDLTKYAIERDGEVKHYVNPTLCQNRNIDDATLEEIKALHHEREDLFDLMRAMDPETDQRELSECGAEFHRIEYELQDLWGFGRNHRFHKFWDIPHCQCPKMDNNDNYPHGVYVYNLSCPVHGRVTQFIQETEKKEEPVTKEYVDKEVEPFKNPLSYKIKTAVEIVAFGALILLPLLALYFLIMHQGAFKEMADYIIRFMG